jgi:hypothetical protein
MRRFLALNLIALALSACGGGDPGAAQDSGIRGRAVLGPTCPVVTEDMPCPPEPYEGEIWVLAAQTDDLVATVRSGQDGRFEVRLAPGDYVLEGDATAESFPYAKPVTVTVRPGAFTRATLAFDTGIRG